MAFLAISPEMLERRLSCRGDHSFHRIGHCSWPTKSPFQSVHWKKTPPRPRVISKVPRNRKETAMKLWKSIEAHHGDLGAALFILPCLLATFSMAGIAFGVALLLA